MRKKPSELSEGFFALTDLDAQLELLRLHTIFTVASVDETKKEVLEAAASAEKRVLSSRSHKQQLPVSITDEDRALSHSLSRAGIPSSPFEVAFARHWQMVGWGPDQDSMLGLRNRLAAQHGRSATDFAITGDAGSWTLYLAAAPAVSE